MITVIFGIVKEGKTEIVQEHVLFDGVENSIIEASNQITAKYGNCHRFFLRCIQHGDRNVRKTSEGFASLH